MNKVLVIGGPTATGKTDLALRLAKKLNGELISADSRQVYRGMDIVTGKDLPVNAEYELSEVKWRNRPLGYYDCDGVKLWLVDIVSANEQCNVSFWNECARLVLDDVFARGKLPIIVGVTGLYIKSLTHSLVNIHVPYDQALRDQMNKMSTAELFDWLNRVNPEKAKGLNESDRKNPRRLMRAIEITNSKSTPDVKNTYFDCLNIGLTGPRELMYDRIDARVEKRITQGAEAEVKRLLNQGFNWETTSMQTSGYKVWKDYLAGKTDIDFLKQQWKWAEHRDFRRQLTWFAKQKGFEWFDVSVHGWSEDAQRRALEWYN